MTEQDGWIGKYCFSYDEHYDPANVSFGRMLACNEFVLQPGAGFGLHRHAGVDVVTTVLSGALTHVTPAGAERRPSGSYVFAAGPGAEHDERNDGDEPVRFVQAWFLPGAADPRPTTCEPGATDLRPETVVLVVEGQADLAGHLLHAGDSARLSAATTLEVAVGGRALAWRC